MFIWVSPYPILNQHTLPRWILGVNKYPSPIGDIVTVIQTAKAYNYRFVMFNALLLSSEASIQICLCKKEGSYAGNVQI